MWGHAAPASISSRRAALQRFPGEGAIPACLPRPLDAGGERGNLSLPRWCHFAMGWRQDLFVNSKLADPLPQWRNLPHGSALLRQLLL